MSMIQNIDATNVRSFFIDSTKNTVNWLKIVGNKGILS
jgi:hypothetical protein